MNVSLRSNRSLPYFNKVHVNALSLQNYELCFVSKAGILTVSLLLKLAMIDTNCIPAVQTKQTFYIIIH